MDRQKAREIIKEWMFPTERTSYMGGLEDRPILASARGSVVVDTDGKEYLDFQSGQMAGAIGHQHPRIVTTVQKALQTIVHATNTMLNVPRLRLHERLGKLLPRPLQKSLFLISGSDSVEASLDLARKATGGVDIIGFHAGLHGSTSYLTRSISFNWDRRKHSVVAPGDVRHPDALLLSLPSRAKLPEVRDPVPQDEPGAGGREFHGEASRLRGRADLERRRGDRASAGLLPGDPEGVR